MRNNYQAKSRLSISSIISVLILVLFASSSLRAQSLAGSTWDLVSTTTLNSGPGFTNWGNGVISLTDTVTSSGSCQGAAVTETGSGYNPTSGAVFSMCFSVFFGCPGNDQIGTIGNPYTDQNGDGLAFSFWKTGGGTYNVNNANTCGGGLGYHNALSGGPDNKMITIEFDTYSSIGTDVDGEYGGGGPGSGINDEVAIHRDQNSGEDFGLVYDNPTPGAFGSSFNAGNLEDGLVHGVCITYTPATRKMKVTIDGNTIADYDMGTTYGLQDYFGNNTLNYTWSAGKYGANNQQTIGPSGNSLVGQIGHVFCPGQLPVDFITFSAVQKEGSVLLNWSTATETNNSKFVVERSADLTNWTAIGEVDGAGNSTSLLQYDHTDYDPIRGASYYRIRQVDQDGQFSYSKIVTIKNEFELVVAPNPFDASFSVHASTSEPLSITIQDVVGRTVYQAESSEPGSMTLSPELESGIYWITLQTNSVTERRQIIRR